MIMISRPLSNRTYMSIIENLTVSGYLNCSCFQNNQVCTRLLKCQKSPQMSRKSSKDPPVKQKLEKNTNLKVRFKTTDFRSDSVEKKFVFSILFKDLPTFMMPKMRKKVWMVAKSVADLLMCSLQRETENVSYKNSTRRINKPYY